MSEAPPSIKFITEKDAAFRTVHADGAWGMANSSGNVILNFYIERPILPRSVDFKYEDGEMTMSDHYDTGGTQTGDDPVGVRDYQSAVILTVPAARQIHTVLGNFIKIAENIIAQEPHE